MIFHILYGWLLNCSLFNATVTAFWKHLPSLFLWFIVVFLFLNYLTEFMYHPPLFRLILWNLWYNKSALLKTNLFSFIDYSKTFWGLFWLKKFKNFFNYFICFITNWNFYVITLTINSTSLFRIFRRRKISSYLGFYGYLSNCLNMV